MCAGSISRFTAAGASITFSITSSGERRLAFAWSAIWLSTRGVRTYAGQMALTVMPYSPPSSAAVRVRPTRPCFAEM